MAEKLGISPRTLRYKLAKMRDAGIDILIKKRYRVLYLGIGLALLIVRV